MLRAHDPVSHEGKEDLQERPPAVPVRSKVLLNSMLHHAADPKRAEGMSGCMLPFAIYTHGIHVTR